jgi:L-lactate utilization protein LutC
MTEHSKVYPLPDLNLSALTATEVDVQHFLEEAGRVGARAQRCRHNDIRSTLLQILQSQPDDAPVLFESRELLQLAGWEVGIQKFSGCLLRDLRQENFLTTRDFDTAAVAIGVTGADFGLCDTGTLVLQSSERRGRLLSLLPPIHVAILQLEQLLPDLASFLARSPENCSAVTFITGPSKTADIEQQLTTGVHGPGEIHIIVVGN